MSEPSPPETQLFAADKGQALIGKRLAHYEITQFLGEGGMATVYLARDTKLGRNVALKLLPSEFTNNPDRLRRFKQEACAASALNHPNILTIYEIGETEGIHFIATEFIEGETLRERMAGASPKTGEVLHIAEQVASALTAAHEAGIIHRDIKPENIMVRRRDGIIKVLDFGVAKLTLTASDSKGVDNEAATELHTKPGIIVGTVNYMSPEQATGRKVDTRSDIFSLAAVVYEMVAGRLAFEGSTAGEMLAAVLSEKEPPPLARFSREVPRELEHIVSKGLRKDPEQRYQTVKDMLIDLRDLRRDLELQAQIERSQPHEVSRSETDAAEVTTSPATTQRSAALNEPESPEHNSSAAYIVHKVKHHRLAALITLAAFALATTLALFWYFKDTRAAPILTEKDTIVLADFVNTTGDAAFDGTLKSALAMQLEQSPFLNIFSNERVRETLRFMNRSPDEPVTKDVAREICLRQGLKAYLVTSISNIGSQFVVTLEAVNAQTGDTLARQQSEAESKEKVLSALGDAATKLREKLGESLASIQKYDAPIEQVTTSSLEALKAYSLGRELHLKGKTQEAVPLLKRAIELDPYFARAYDALSYSYGNLGQEELAQEAVKKAFELRERSSEYEKLKAESNYYTRVTGETDKATETLELLSRTYPRDYMAHNMLGTLYNGSGKHESAIEEAREAIRLNPNLFFGYSQLGIAFMRLNRFDEAKQVYEQALAQKIDRIHYHANLYAIAFVQGDSGAMEQQLEWARGKPDGYQAFFWQAETAAFEGLIKKSRDLNQRGADAELAKGLKDAAANTYSLNASIAAVTGDCKHSREAVARASALARNSFYSFPRKGLALALCNELGEAQKLADEGTKQFSKHTLMNAVWLPAIRAAIEIRRNNPAQAIQFLHSANRYDRVGIFFPEYLRGQAYLAQNAGAEAAVEFQKILDRRGLAPASVLYPLAHLGLARAAKLQGDSAKARQSYQNFFALWSNADADLPILIEARREYEQLK